MSHQRPSAAEIKRERERNGNSLFRWSQPRNSQLFFFLKLRKPPKQTQETFIKHLLCSRLYNQLFYISLLSQALWNGYSLHFQKSASRAVFGAWTWLTSVGTVARTTGCCPHCSHQMVRSMTPESSIAGWVQGETSDWLSLVMCLCPSWPSWALWLW